MKEENKLLDDGYLMKRRKIKGHGQPTAPYSETSKDSKQAERKRGQIMQGTCTWTRLRQGTTEKQVHVP